MPEKILRYSYSTIPITPLFIIFQHFFLTSVKNRSTIAYCLGGIVKLSDYLAILLGTTLSIFFIYEPLRSLYILAYENQPILVSFCKFGLLATSGEMLVHRIKKGTYCTRQFGVFPKMLIWGILGVAIYFAFAIFSNGVTGLFHLKKMPLLNAFLISFFLNLIFAPVMMLTHHLTDMHITNGSGRFFIKTFSPLLLLKSADWDKMWSFVYKKTIPFFWIPAHTITFLLPTQFRTLFAALLSIALGLLLSISTGKKIEI